jgi:1-deoxy-D-xylulose-5-phosphate synthase
MFRDAMDITTGPVAIRWPRTPAPMVDEHEVGCGLAGRRVSADEDARVCLVGVGKMLADVEQAAIQLRAQGIACTVWDPRVVQPFDPALVADAARHEVVVTIEDGMAEGGVGNRLAALVGDAAVDAGAAHPPWVVNLGTPREFLAHGLPEQILADLGLDADGIVAAVTSRLR